jgi:hypothetical protein
VKKKINRNINDACNSDTAEGWNRRKRAAGAIGGWILENVLE